jgi:hypothetical protein
VDFGSRINGNSFKFTLFQFGEAVKEVRVKRKAGSPNQAPAST